MENQIRVRGVECELVCLGEIDAVAKSELDGEAATAAVAQRAHDFIAEAHPRVGDLIMLLRHKPSVPPGGGCSTT